MPNGDLPIPTEGMLVARFIAVADISRARAFYSQVLGGTVVMQGEPSMVKLGNIWIALDVGGGPTDDKPDVRLEPPPDRSRASEILVIRVPDVHATYDELLGRGATFLTPPRDRGTELRCYLRDPDGHLIEVSQVKRP